MTFCRFCLPETPRKAFPTGLRSSNPFEAVPGSIHQKAIRNVLHVHIQHPLTGLPAKPRAESEQGLAYVEVGSAVRSKVNSPST